MNRTALLAALPGILAEMDDAGSTADDWIGSEYVDRLATALAALLAPSADAGGRTGAELIVAERQRQIDEEGYDAAHDSGHADELAAAAATYAIASPRTYDMAYGATTVHVELGVGLWPWDRRWWKPTPDDRIRELVKAGALIAAAIDALEGKS
jgi:hypothetical protein